MAVGAKLVAGSALAVAWSLGLRCLGEREGAASTLYPAGVSPLLLGGCGHLSGAWACEDGRWLDASVDKPATQNGAAGLVLGGHEGWGWAVDKRMGGKVKKGWGSRAWDS